jgi:hypothetical protein
VDAQRLNGDRKYYIDKYVLNRMVDYNFSPNAPRAKIKFRKMGNENSQLIQTVIQALLNSGKAGWTSSSSATWPA